MEATVQGTGQRVRMRLGDPGIRGTLTKGLKNLRSSGVVGTEKTREWSLLVRGHPHIMSGGGRRREGPV